MSKNFPSDVGIKPEGNLEVKRERANISYVSIRMYTKHYGACGWHATIPKEIAPRSGAADSSTRRSCLLRLASNPIHFPAVRFFTFLTFTPPKTTTSIPSKSPLSIINCISNHHELHRPAHRSLRTPQWCLRIATGKPNRSSCLHKRYVRASHPRQKLPLTSNPQQVPKPQSLDSSPPPVTRACS
jgi:hypothetical protein